MVPSDFQEVSGKVVRKSDGFVAMKHYNPNPSTAIIEQDGTVYNFTTTAPDNAVHNNSLSMAIVSPNHVDQLCRVLAQICCGKTAHKFVPANSLDLSLWLTGNR